MSYKIQSSAIIHELLDDEAIIANLDTGVYYSIRGNGIAIWQLLLAGYDPEVIVSRVNETYRRDLKESVSSFIQRLVEEALLVEDPNMEPSLWTPTWPKEWSGLKLEKYEEMKNLLALDPIHEVDELGWPAKSK